MKTYYNPDKATWPEILKRPMLDISELLNQAKGILTEIQQNGETALREFTRQFDEVDIENFEVSQAEFEAAEANVSEDLKQAIKIAAENISKFHKSQLPVFTRIETTTGVYCWQKPIGIESVGLYVPGGTAPLFSTVLMLAIPAKLAGCREIIVCTPPSKDGTINPVILYAAKLSGVTRVFKLGGVQAIGAMAYGVISPKVNKIFGPGNQFVMAAKQLVSFSDVAIDMPAGPSEVTVMADSTSNPAFIASDLLSQAEHGPDSQVVLVLKGDSILGKVQDEISKQLAVLPRKDIASKSLESSRIIVFDEYRQMIDLVNWYAPEHLIVCTNNYGELAGKIINAGSVFLGNFTPESAGDYASGTNHTLPTNGWARSVSGISIDSFIRKITFQEITSTGMKNLGPVIEVMAEAEHLHAHKNAVTLRLNLLKNR